MNRPFLFFKYWIYASALCLWSICLSHSLCAQDVEQVFKAKPLTITGGLSLGSSIYHQWHREARRDPFAYELSANINFNFFGVVNAPFSASLSSQNQTFNAPSYKQIGISPSYKWITVHAGWRNMNFSPYTLSGSNFLGVGLEIKPKELPFQAKCVYGRFAQKTKVTDSMPFAPRIAYDRWGYGMGISGGTSKRKLELIIFHIEDKFSGEDTTTLAPQANLCFALATNQQLGKQFKLSVQYTGSKTTFDIRKEADSLIVFGSVWDVGLDFQSKFFTTGIAYKRIGPDFQSFGIPYLTKNLQDVLMKFSVPFFKKKVNFAMSGGIQKNNLDGRQNNSSKRFIGSFNGNWQCSEVLNFYANYSNLSSIIESKSVFEEDKTQLMQISKNLDFGGSYNIRSEQNEHLFNLLYAFQNAIINNMHENLSEEAKTPIHNASAGYRVNNKKTKSGASVSLNFCRSSTESVLNYNYGSSISINKDFFKQKIKSNFIYSLQRSSMQTSTNTMHSVRINGNYNISKHHRFAIGSNFSFFKNKQKSSELNIHLSYNYNF